MSTASVWSKTTPITGGVGGAGAGDVFFQISLALIMPISKNVQLNGASELDLTITDFFCINSSANGSQVGSKCEITWSAYEPLVQEFKVWKTVARISLGD